MRVNASKKKKFFFWEQDTLDSANEMEVATHCHCHSIPLPAFHVLVSMHIWPQAIFSRIFAVYTIHIYTYIVCRFCVFYHHSIHILLSVVVTKLLCFPPSASVYSSVFFSIRYPLLWFPFFFYSFFLQIFSFLFRSPVSRIRFISQFQWLWIDGPIWYTFGNVVNSHAAHSHCQLYRIKQNGNGWVCVRFIKDNKYWATMRTERKKRRRNHVTSLPLDLRL